MSYTLYAEDGETPIHVFHTDRELCDDDGCVCMLPSSAQLYAQRTADDRDVWYVMVHEAKAFLGPVSAEKARRGVDDALAAGHKPKLLRVVEDYT